MESIADGISFEAESMERELGYWKEVLQKSEKYERLMADDDFKDVLKDIQHTVDAHHEEIKKCLEGMAEYGPRQLADAQHTLFIHQVLEDQAVMAVKRPKEILELAKEARKKIPLLEENIKRKQEELTNV